MDEEEERDAADASRNHQKRDASGDDPGGSSGKAILLDTHVIANSREIDVYRRDAAHPEINFLSVNRLPPPLEAVDTWQAHNTASAATGAAAGAAASAAGGLTIESVGVHREARPAGRNGPDQAAEPVHASGDSSPLMHQAREGGDEDKAGEVVGNFTAESVVQLQRGRSLVDCPTGGTGGLGMSVEGRKTILQMYCQLAQREGTSRVMVLALINDLPANCGPSQSVVGHVLFVAASGKEGYASLVETIPQDIQGLVRQFLSDVNADRKAKRAWMNKSGTGKKGTEEAGELDEHESDSGATTEWSFGDDEEEAARRRRLSDQQRSRKANADARKARHDAIKARALRRRKEDETARAELQVRQDRETMARIAEHAQVDARRTALQRLLRHRLLQQPSTKNEELRNAFARRTTTDLREVLPWLQQATIDRDLALNVIKGEMDHLDKPVLDIGRFRKGLDAYIRSYNHCLARSQGPRAPDVHSMIAQLRDKADRCNVLLRQIVSASTPHTLYALGLHRPLEYNTCHSNATLQAFAAATSVAKALEGAHLHELVPVDWSVPEEMRRDMSMANVTPAHVRCIQKCFKSFARLVLELSCAKRPTQGRRILTPSAFLKHRTDPLAVEYFDRTGEPFHVHRQACPAEMSEKLICVFRDFGYPVLWEICRVEVRTRIFGEDCSGVLHESTHSRTDDHAILYLNLTSRTLKGCLESVFNDSVQEWRPNGDAGPCIAQADRVGSICKTGPVLLFSLNRTQWLGQTLQKNGTRIDFPEEFAIGEFFPAADDSVADIRYRLVALKLHGGQDNGGHYRAIVFRRDSYYLIDDRHVSKMSGWDEVLRIGRGSGDQVSSCATFFVYEVIPEHARRFDPIVVRPLSGVRNTSSDDSGTPDYVPGQCSGAGTQKGLPTPLAASHADPSETTTLSKPSAAAASSVGSQSHSSVDAAESGSDDEHDEAQSGTRASSSKPAQTSTVLGDSHTQSGGPSPANTVPRQSSAPAASIPESAGPTTVASAPDSGPQEATFIEKSQARHTLIERRDKALLLARAPKSTADMVNRFSTLMGHCQEAYMRVLVSLVEPDRAHQLFHRLPDLVEATSCIFPFVQDICAESFKIATMRVAELLRTKRGPKVDVEYHLIVALSCQEAARSQTRRDLDRSLKAYDELMESFQEFNMKHLGSLNPKAAALVCLEGLLKTACDLIPFMKQVVDNGVLDETQTAQLHEFLNGDRLKGLSRQVIWEHEKKEYSVSEYDICLAAQRTAACILLLGHRREPAVHALDMLHAAFDKLIRPLYRATKAIAATEFSEAPKPVATISKTIQDQIQWLMSSLFDLRRAIDRLTIQSCLVQLYENRHSATVAVGTESATQPATATKRNSAWAGDKMFRQTGDITTESDPSVQPVALAEGDHGLTGGEIQPHLDPVTAGATPTTAIASTGRNAHKCAVREANARRQKLARQQKARAANQALECQRAREAGARLRCFLKQLFALDSDLYECILRSKRSEIVNLNIAGILAAGAFQMLRSDFSGAVGSASTSGRRASDGDAVNDRLGLFHPFPLVSVSSDTTATARAELQWLFIASTRALMACPELVKAFNLEDVLEPTDSHRVLGTLSTKIRRSTLRKACRLVFLACQAELPRHVIRAGQNVSLCVATIVAAAGQFFKRRDEKYLTQGLAHGNFLHEHAVSLPIRGAAFYNGDYILSIGHQDRMLYSRIPASSISSKLQQRLVVVLQDMKTSGDLTESGIGVWKLSSRAVARRYLWLRISESREIEAIFTVPDDQLHTVCLEEQATRCHVVEMRGVDSEHPLQVSATSLMREHIFVQLPAAVRARLKIGEVIVNSSHGRNNEIIHALGTNTSREAREFVTASILCTWQHGLRDPTKPMSSLFCAQDKAKWSTVGLDLVGCFIRMLRGAQKDKLVKHMVNASYHNDYVTAGADGTSPSQLSRALSELTTARSRTPFRPVETSVKSTSACRHESLSHWTAIILLSTYFAVDIPDSDAAAFRERADGVALQFFAEHDTPAWELSTLFKSCVVLSRQWTDGLQKKAGQLLESVKAAVNKTKIDAAKVQSAQIALRVAETTETELRPAVSSTHSNAAEHQGAEDDSLTTASSASDRGDQDAAPRKRRRATRPVDNYTRASRTRSNHRSTVVWTLEYGTDAQEGQPPSYRMQCLESTPARICQLVDNVCKDRKQYHLDTGPSVFVAFHADAMVGIIVHGTPVGREDLDRFLSGIGVNSRSTTRRRPTRPVLYLTGNTGKNHYVSELVHVPWTDAASVPADANWASAIRQQVIDQINKRKQPSPEDAARAAAEAAARTATDVAVDAAKKVRECRYKLRAANGTLTKAVREARKIMNDAKTVAVLTELEQCLRSVREIEVSATGALHWATRISDTARRGSIRTEPTTLLGEPSIPLVDIGRAEAITKSSEKLMKDLAEISSPLGQELTKLTAKFEGLKNQLDATDPSVSSRDATAPAGSTTATADRLPSYQNTSTASADGLHAESTATHESAHPPATSISDLHSTDAIDLMSRTRQRSGSKETVDSAAKRCRAAGSAGDPAASPYTTAAAGRSLSARAAAAASADGLRAGSVATHEATHPSATFTLDSRGAARVDFETHVHERLPLGHSTARTAKPRRAVHSSVDTAVISSAGTVTAATSSLLSAQTAATPSASGSHTRPTVPGAGRPSLDSISDSPLAVATNRVRKPQRLGSNATPAAKLHRGAQTRADSPDRDPLCPSNGDRSEAGSMAVHFHSKFGPEQKYFSSPDVAELVIPGQDPCGTRPPPDVPMRKHGKAHAGCRSLQRFFVTPEDVRSQSGFVFWGNFWNASVNIFKKYLSQGPAPGPEPSLPVDIRRTTELHRRNAVYNAMLLINTIIELRDRASEHVNADKLDKSQKTVMEDQLAYLFIERHKQLVATVEDAMRVLVLAIKSPDAESAPYLWECLRWFAFRVQGTATGTFDAWFKTRPDIETHERAKKFFERCFVETASSNSKEKHARIRLLPSDGGDMFDAWVETVKTEHASEHRGKFIEFWKESMLRRVELAPSEHERSTMETPTSTSTPHGAGVPPTRHSLAATASQNDDSNDLGEGSASRTATPTDGQDGHIDDETASGLARKLTAGEFDAILEGVAEETCTLRLAPGVQVTQLRKPLEARAFTAALEKIPMSKAQPQATVPSGDLDMDVVNKAALAACRKSNNLRQLPSGARLYLLIAGFCPVLALWLDKSLRTTFKAIPPKFHRTLDVAARKIGDSIRLPDGTKARILRTLKHAKSTFHAAGVDPGIVTAAVMALVQIWAGTGKQRELLETYDGDKKERDEVAPDPEDEGEIAVPDPPITNDTPSHEDAAAAVPAGERFIGGASHANLSTNQHIYATLRRKSMFELLLFSKHQPLIAAVRVAATASVLSHRFKSASGSRQGHRAIIDAFEDPKGEPPRLTNEASQDVQERVETIWHSWRRRRQQGWAKAGKQGKCQWWSLARTMIETALSLKHLPCTVELSKILLRTSWGRWTKKDHEEVMHGKKRRVVILAVGDGGHLAKTNAQVFRRPGKKKGKASGLVAATWSTTGPLGLYTYLEKEYCGARVRSLAEDGHGIEEATIAVVRVNEFSTSSQCKSCGKWADLAGAREKACSNNQCDMFGVVVDRDAAAAVAIAGRMLAHLGYTPNAFWKQRRNTSSRASGQQRSVPLT